MAQVVKFRSMPEHLGKSKHALNLAIFQHLSASFPATAVLFAQEAQIDENAVETGDGGPLSDRWLSVTRLQLKIGELEEERDELRTRLTLFEKVTTFQTDFEGLPLSPAKMSFSGHSKSISKLEFHPVFQFIVSASEDHTIKIWEYEGFEGVLKKTLQNHRGSVTFFAFDQNGTRMATASADSSIKIWDFASFECVSSLYGHSDIVSGLAFTENDQSLVSCSRDRTVRLWNLASGECVQIWRNGGEWVRSVATSGNLLAYCGNDRKVYVHKGRSEEACLSLDEAHDHVIEFCAFATAPVLATLLAAQQAPSPLPGHVIYALGDETFWRYDSGKEGYNKNILKNKNNYSINNKNNNSLNNKNIFQKAGPVLFTASRDKTFKMWNITNGTLMRNFVGHDGWVHQVEPHVSGKYLLSCSDDHSIRTWDVLTGKCLTVLISSSFVTSIAIRSDPNIVASACSSGKIEVWECRKQIQDASV